MPTPTKEQRYKATLISLFSHKDEIQYAKDHEFTEAELTALVPGDICRFMKWKAYGNPDANIEMDNPTEGRSSALEFYKKAISFFIPMRNATWNPTMSCGNPTRSVQVNELIKKVKKKEVRRQGAPSQARREMEEAEFLQTNELLNGEQGVKKRFMLPAAAKFQFQMVARVDDVAHFKEEDLKPHPQFDFVLHARMGWSKNVLEERDAPDQIILGAFNSYFCCILGLAIFLEAWKEYGIGDTNPFLFGESNDPDITKNWMSDQWRQVWNSEVFVRHANGPLGTHSFRKFPATRARRMGCDKDDIDSRGRWRKLRVQDRYVSANLPFPDAKVASALCVGGPCKYELVNGGGITQEWLREVVVPNIIGKPGIANRVADVLALPLLWAAMDNEMETRMPAMTRNRIRNAYAACRVLEEGVNPVRKRLVIVSGMNATVIINVMPDDLGGDGNGINNGGAAGIGGGGAGGGFLTGADGQAIHARLHAIETGLLSVREEVNKNQESTTRLINVVNRNVCRIAVQPGIQQAAANDNMPQEVAQLSPLPRNLHTLWQEYTTGIGGRKAARLFTEQERGQNKYKYHRRKVVWDVIARLVRGGRTAQTAVDMIYNAYGHVSVTAIINQMRRDRAHGGHPNLV